MRGRCVASVLAAVLAGTACVDPKQVQPDGTSWMIANLHGAVMEEFRGDATFVAGLELWMGVDRVQVSSRRLESEQFLTVHLLHYGSSRLPEGHYSLSRLNAAGLPPEIGTMALVTESRGSSLRIWTSVDGTLEITRSTPDLLEGRFSFQAIECGPRECAPDPNPIHVTGTFSALPHDEAAGERVPGERTSL